MRRFVFCKLVALALLPLAAPALAHHGPEHVIEELTDRINAGGPTAELLIRRADEWRALGKSENAVSDLRQALEIEPRSIEGRLSLAKVFLFERDWPAAIDAAQRGLQLADNPSEAAPLHAIVARSHEHRDDDEAALESWSLAIESKKPSIDWLLGHAETLRRLDRPTESRDALAEAIERNPSVVLRRAYIESLIDCEEFDDASLRIERGLARARWDASWLLLRASLHQARGERAAARADAEAALAELAERFGGREPIPAIEALESKARALLGEAE